MSSIEIMTEIRLYLFNFGSKHFLVTVDYCSNAFEIDEQEKTTSQQVIIDIKNVCRPRWSPESKYSFIGHIFHRLN